MSEKTHWKHQNVSLNIKQIPQRKYTNLWEQQLNLCRHDVLKEKGNNYGKIKNKKYYYFLMCKEYIKFLNNETELKKKKKVRKNIN